MENTCKPIRGVDGTDRENIDLDPQEPTHGDRAGSARMEDPKGSDVTLNGEKRSLKCPKCKSHRNTDNDTLRRGGKFAALRRLKCKALTKSCAWKCRCDILWYTCGLHGKGSANFMQNQEDDPKDDGPLADLEKALLLKDSRLPRGPHHLLP